LAAFGLIGCGITTAVAFGFRTWQTLEKNKWSWKKSWRSIAADGVTSVATFGLGGAFRFAKYGVYVLTVGKARIFFGVSDVLAIPIGGAFILVGWSGFEFSPRAPFDLVMSWVGIVAGVFLCFWEARHSVSWVSGAGVRMFPFVGRFEAPWV
jgi:hypothetical protein